MNDIREFLSRRPLLFDGGMGTYYKAAPGIECERANQTDPAGVQAVHREYLEAGADAIKTNTFGLPRMAAAHTPGWEALAEAGWKLAEAAAAPAGAFVFADLGPAPETEALPAAQVYTAVAEQFRKLGAKNFLFETLSSDAGILEAVRTLKTAEPDAFVLVSFAVLPDGYTREGLYCKDLVRRMSESGCVDAVGLNCVSAPGAMRTLARSLSSVLPLSVMPNAGYPVVTRTQVRYQGKPEYFAQELSGLAADGVVRILGGCCGTTPAHISKMIEVCRKKPFAAPVPKHRTVVSSFSQTVEIGPKPVIIGERINPTGKKRFQAALKANDIDYILEQAVQQTDAGADILDVNVGLPEIDEKDMMIRIVKALQSIGDTPLQLDSTIPEVLEAALRVYNGKPIVNSVNGEEASLQAILPLVKKYGAAVVGLTLDENGIPKKADDRFAIAKRILERAMAMGIPKQDVYIDCLVLTVSAEQDGAVETLKAMRRVHEELGLRTVLGVSNISFGLPNREAVNRTFLTLAMENGLFLPIMNPNIASMTEAVRAYKVLKGIDRSCMQYISSYTGQTSAKPAAATAGAADSSMTLAYAMEHGLKKECGSITAKLLETTEPMEIINNMLIPVLDETGTKFEQGKVFLPQLILTADAAQAAFSVIKETMQQRDQAPVSKGKIVLATVKGDIHDIGKNIVKVLLENYGYTVIDLGKDVPCQAVVDAAIEHQVKLVGLSALMTTTLGSMEETIRLLHEQYPSCQTVVGGAVLTPDYAKQIHATFYAKDAKDTVDVAKQVVG